MSNARAGALPAASAPARWIVAACRLGIVARIAVCLVSTGSNDIRAWEAFGRAIREHGLAALYRADPLFNHPPLMGLYAAAMSAVSERFGLPFPVLFKLPMVAADALVLVILQRCAARPGAPGDGARAALVWAWAPAAILVSAFHGNSDALCAALTLSAVVLVVHGRSPLAGGLAMAAALNVKLIPVLVVPALLAHAYDRRSMTRFVAGAAAGAVPFAVAAMTAGAPMLRNLFGWSGMPDLWGIFGVLRPLGHHAAGSAPWAPAAVEVLASVAKYTTLLAAVALAVHARVSGRRLDVRLPALVMVLFLLLAPGFGVQYVHYVAPLLLLADLTAGTAFVCVSGAFVVAVYSGFVVSWLPLTTRHTGRMSVTAALLGALTWLVLAAIAVRLWRASPAPVTRRTRLPAPAEGPSTS